MNDHEHVRAHMFCQSNSLVHSPSDQPAAEQNAILDAVPGDPNDVSEIEDIEPPVIPPPVLEHQFSASECWESVVTCATAAGMNEDIVHKLNRSTYPTSPRVYDRQQLEEAGQTLSDLLLSA